ncbi:MAG: NUDIX domain-containing protein [Acidimicrobiales bacterium]
MRTRQRLAAYALIVDDSGRVLLTRQAERRGRLSRWLLPGGGVEAGEHPEDAVVRECLEETGLAVQVVELRSVASDLSRVGRRRSRLHSVRMIYRARVVPGSGTADSGLPANTRWLTPQECQTLSLAPFVAEALSSGGPLQPPPPE